METGSLQNYDSISQAYNSTYRTQSEPNYCLSMGSTQCYQIALSRLEYMLRTTYRHPNFNGPITV